MDSYMMRFVRNKIIHFIVLMVAVSIFSFILLDLSPIDPVNLYLKQSPITPAQRALLEQYWGVGQPITTKLFNWFTNFIQGNLGNSLIFRKPVVDVILEKFAASLVLMFLSWVVSGVLGFILGVLAGKNKGSWIDKCIRVYCYILQSAPTFWVALLVLVVFSIELGWFPVGLGVPIGVSSSNVNIWQWIARLVLPTLTLSMVGVAPITLYTRNELLNVLSSVMFYLLDLEVKVDGI